MNPEDLIEAYRAMQPTSSDAEYERNNMSAQVPYGMIPEGGNVSSIVAGWMGQKRQDPRAVWTWGSQNDYYNPNGLHNSDAPTMVGLNRKSLVDMIFNRAQPYDYGVLGNELTHHYQPKAGQPYNPVAKFNTSFMPGSWKQPSWFDKIGGARPQFYPNYQQIQQQYDQSKFFDDSPFILGNNSKIKAINGREMQSTLIAKMIENLYQARQQEEYQRQQAPGLPIR